MIDDKNVGHLMPLNIEDELKKSFISYAMAVIVSRALPDVRDGLKPVHRRILYSMTELGVTPDKPFRKSARIVGDVLGKYHPHGDSSVYDAMVRLAQDFATHYPLVEGQGNFGSVDGDGAAAMRYTEARLSKLSMEMVRDLEKETVDFYPNFDETLMQPAVMPSRFPNLLVNGSSGIAVGMATNIPPHNLGEVIDGVVCMIDNPECTVDDLMQCVKGPDFPTGGVILGRRGIYDTYHTGRGRIVVRARSEIEEMPNNRQRIVVTEIPYMVNKAKLIEKIAEMVHDKTVEGISDIRDESDRRGMRIVIELKRDTNASVVLNTLYKHTQLQDTFGAIMLALVDGEPKVLSLKQIIFHYLQHQEDVIRRRTKYDLDKAEARSHILEGLMIALDNIDEVIALIRASRTAQDARDGLMSRFGLTERQAQAILDMRLQRLTGLERDKIEAEYAELQKLIAYYKEVLADERKLLGIIKDEILEIKRKYADERKTEISAMDGEIDMLDLIDEEDMVVTMTHFGYVKRLPKTTYRAQRRGGKGVVGATTRAGQITGPLRDRFGVLLKLELYSPDELSRIIMRSAGILDQPITPEGAYELAKCSRGTPRVANRFLKRIRDFATVLGDGIIDRDVALLGLKRMDVDALGLDELDRSLLRAIIEMYNGGPVGLETLAAALGEEAVTLEDLCEPYLMQMGFLTRTPRGRCATRLAYEHLGLKAPEAAAPEDNGQQSLF